MVILAANYEYYGCTKFIYAQVSAAKLSKTVVGTPSYIPVITFFIINYILTNFLSKGLWVLKAKFSSLFKIYEISNSCLDPMIIYRKITISNGYCEDFLIF